MSIRFTCPNGHELNVKEKYAGLTGLCPKCQVRVLVPVPAVKLTDDAIIDLLGPPPAPDDELPVHQDSKHRGGKADPESSSGVTLRGLSPLNRGMKICPKCRREVRAVYDICPHCRTYFSDAGEVNRRLTLTCKKCGHEYEHHVSAIWCKQCGADLREQNSLPSP
jgi:Zn-finger nucleic acid-binding protein